MARACGIAARPWLVFILVVGSGCVARPAARAAGRVRIALATAPLSLDPHATNEIVAFSVNSNIYDTLVGTDADLRPQPRLAFRWFNTDDRTWCFDLVPAIRFQDGSSLTSADVAYSLLRARNDPLSEWAGGLLTVDRVETPSPFRVVVHTRAPDATLIQALAQTLIVPRTSGPIARSSLKMHPIGSGPYRLASRDAATGRLDLVAWEGFWGNRPSIEHVFFSAIPDDQRRVGALLSGEQDLVNDVPPEIAPSIESAKGFQSTEVAGLMEIYLGFDVGRDRTPYASPPQNPFRKRLVRRAFLAAINRERLVRDAVAGAGEPADQLVAERVLGFDPDLPDSPFDIALARRLMAEAGFPNGFSVTLDAPAASYVGDLRVAPFLARSLAEIGVRVDVRSLPKEELFRRETGRDTSLFIAGWNCTSGDMQEVLDFLLHTPDPGLGYGSENAGGYSNQLIDRLAEEAHRTMQLQPRLHLLRTASRAAMEDVPWVPLYTPRQRYGTREGLRWTPRPDGLIRCDKMALAPAGRP